MNQLIDSLEKTYAHALETAKLKNADYANVGDPYRNFKMVEVLGITSVEEGILTRMSDKFTRICNLVKRDNMVMDEKITDTLADLINYSAILKAYIEQK